MQEFRRRYPNGRVTIIVPTMTLLDQWYVALQEEFGVPAADIACFSSQEKTSRPALVNVLVINSARRLVRDLNLDQDALLVVDECHRAGSGENAKALKGAFTAALGLSATPQREYDQGFEELVVPVVGPVIFEYDYTQAHKDGVVSSFDLVNVQVDMLPHEQDEYDRLSKRAAVLFRKISSRRAQPGDPEKLKRVLQLRAAVSAKALMRLPVAARIVEQNRGARTLMFHERISSAQALYEILVKRKHSVCLYHSQIPQEKQRANLQLFSRGVFVVLISCSALDEGMNVPETAVAVIVSSTASQRQRIQRLGRVLRPSRGKDKALVYTIFATKQERVRLEKEASHLEGVAGVSWTEAKREARV
jgi:superfamily II DNA or RNA helicase